MLDCEVDEVQQNILSSIAVLVSDLANGTIFVEILSLRMRRPNKCFCPIAGTRHYEAFYACKSEFFAGLPVLAECVFEEKTAASKGAVSRESVASRKEAVP